MLLPEVTLLRLELDTPGDEKFSLREILWFLLLPPVALLRGGVALTAGDSDDSDDGNGDMVRASDVYYPFE